MKKNKDYYRLRQVVSFFMDLCIAGIIVLVINSFLVQNLRVEGKSMFPFLDNGNMVLINKIAYVVDEPQRGDVIGFYSDTINQNVVKRIIGLPGDCIDFKNGMIYVNDQPIEDHTMQSNIERGDIQYPYVVPENGYFVLGDNYAQSIDSRFGVIGIVEENEIIGRIDFRVWPLSRQTL